MNDAASESRPKADPDPAPRIDLSIYPDVDPNIDIARLMSDLANLAMISEAEPPVVTRVVYSAADLRARAFVDQLCQETGLTLRTDAIGNTFARWQGSDPSLPPVATGSHIDAIPNAGAYDGTVGVLGGLEAIRALQKAGFRPRRSIELVIFTSEEPTRFGIGCLGSRMMSGVMTPQQASSLRDNHGQTLDELRSSAKFEGHLSSVPLPDGHFYAFLELHIEQGPLLEKNGLDIGIVTHIAAPASVRIVIDGEGGHAGAMLMPDRHDALAAGAELILAIESFARSAGTIDTVATVGICKVFPGAVNSVPSRVRLETDIRDTDGTRRDLVLSKIHEAGDQIAARRGVSLSFDTVNADPPATCSEFVIDAVGASCAESGRTAQRMVSRAYHDSLFVARFAPVGMIFIPSRGGISHRPDEFSSASWIQTGVTVLAKSLAKLSI